jgi:excisionase family DNA binding protein
MGLLNVAQVSDMLNVKRNTIYAWADQGRLPYIDLGDGGKRCLMFRQEDIEEFVTKRERKVKNDEQRGDKGL